MVASGLGSDESDVSSANFDIPNDSIADVGIPSHLSDLPGVRQELVGCCKAVATTNIGVGLSLAELKQRGPNRDTFIMSVSDNGAPFFLNPRRHCTTLESSRRSSYSSLVREQAW